MSSRSVTRWVVVLTAIGSLMAALDTLIMPLGLALRSAAFDPARAHPDAGEPRPRDRARLRGLTLITAGALATVWALVRGNLAGAAAGLALPARRPAVRATVVPALETPC